MPLPLIPLVAGAVARSVGTRVVAGAATRSATGGSAGGAHAAGRAAQFGGRAIQMSAMHQPRQQAPAPQRPAGRVARTADWARNNPVEAGVVVSGVFSGSSMAAQANADFDSITQPRQFSG